MRTEGYAVESILRVLRQQGLKIAARTYRAWKSPVRIAARTVTDALVEDKIRDLAWTINPATGQVHMTPEGLYVSIRPVERQSVLRLSATRYRGRAPVDRVGERQPSGPTLTDAVVRSWRARCARACSSHRW